MAYEYNPRAYYAPYGKHRELIAANDLGKLEIVVEMITKRVKVS